MLIKSTRENPNFKNLARVIKIVKQAFLKESDDEKSKKKGVKKDSILSGLKTTEYMKIFNFFAEELPALLIKTTGMKTNHFV